MKSDRDIRQDVEAELKWSPDVEETDIAVKVTEGAVTLSGFVKSFFEKYRAEVAARRVKGVAAVANDLQVKLPSAGRSDPELARAAVAALKEKLPFTAEQIVPTVKDGHVYLSGEVEWNYQREYAEEAIRHIKGITGLRNSLTVKPTVAPPDNIKHRIEDAFRRIAQVDAGKIVVDTSGSEVTLRGEVRSWAERDQAQATAWSAPGVSFVKNEISVRT